MIGQSAFGGRRKRLLVGVGIFMRSAATLAVAQRGFRHIVSLGSRPNTAMLSGLKL
jgi:hypothetical protein